MAPDRSSLDEWVTELKRRNVFRVAAVYAAVAFVLVQATAYVFEALLFPSWAHRLFVVFVLLGFPVALVMAWAFELTPEGVRPSQELYHEEGEDGGGVTVSHFGWSRVLVAMGLVTVVGAGVGMAGWAAWEAWLAPEASGATGGAAADSAGADLPATRIAVLYFDDHTENDELEHVAAGFTESLIHELNQAPGLDVVSRNGVKPYRNPEVPLDSIARALGAGSLVEGSVEREGNDLLVTVQLVDGATATHLLSERVRGHVDSPLAVRNELVEKVADLLRRELGQEVRLRQARAGTESSRAWELYHLARDIRADADSFRREGDAKAARQLYLQADSVLAEAEAIDPGWQWPTLQRGEVALSLGRVGNPEVADARETWLERGIEHAERVLSDDPDNAAALELRGEVRYFLALTRASPEAERLLDAAASDLQRAVSIDPGRAGAWSRLAYLHWREARFAKARSAVRRSREADRFLLVDREYLYLRASLALDMEEFERADRLLQEALEEYPDDPAFLFKRLQHLASTGSTRSAVARARDVLRRYETVTDSRPWLPGRILVAAVAARSGMTDSARAILRSTTGPASSLSAHAANNAAYAWLQLGDEQKALDLLAVYLERRPDQRDYVAREWWWRPLRDDSRFRALVDDTAEEAGARGEAAAAGGQ